MTAFHPSYCSASVRATVLGSLCYFRDVSAVLGFTLVCSQIDHILSLSRRSRLPRNKSPSPSCGLPGPVRSGLQSFSPTTLASRWSPERTELGLVPALLSAAPLDLGPGELVRAACAACGSPARSLPFTRLNLPREFTSLRPTRPRSTPDLRVCFSFR